MCTLFFEEKYIYTFFICLSQYLIYMNHCIEYTMIWDSVCMYSVNDGALGQQYSLFVTCQSSWYFAVFVFGALGRK